MEYAGWKMWEWKMRDLDSEGAFVNRWPCNNALGKQAACEFNMYCI